MSPSCASLTRLNSLLHWSYFKGAEDWGVEELLKKHSMGQGASQLMHKYCSNVYLEKQLFAYVLVCENWARPMLW